MGLTPFCVYNVQHAKRFVNMICVIFTVSTNANRLTAANRTKAGSSLQRRQELPEGKSLFSAEGLQQGVQIALVMLDLAAEPPKRFGQALVGAKSASVGTVFRRFLLPLPCASSPHHDRFTGS